MLRSTDANNLLFREPGRPFHHREIVIPPPAQGELLIEVELCTICGSDLHTISGRRAARGPTVLGHEIVGRICQRSGESPSRDVQGNELQLGDRVSWSIHASCGECFFCRQGLHQKCAELFKYGHQPDSDQYPSTGGFASHCQILSGTSIVRVPDFLPDVVAAPLNCATATVAATFRQAGDCRDGCVLILGAGMLGLTAVAWAKESDAASIIVVEPNAVRAELASEFGATRVANNMDIASDCVAKPTNQRGADVVFDFSGSNQAICAGVDLCRVGGRVILAGSVFPTDPISINPETIVRKLLQISGVHNYVAKDLLSAVEFMNGAHARYPFESLVAHTYKLTDIETALEHAARGDAVRIGLHA